MENIKLQVDEHTQMKEAIAKTEELQRQFSFRPEEEAAPMNTEEATPLAEAQQPEGEVKPEEDFLALDLRKVRQERTEAELKALAEARQLPEK